MRRARSGSGRPRAATESESNRLSTIVRAGQTAALHGVNARRSAIEVECGSFHANRKTPMMARSAAATRRSAGLRRMKVPRSAPCARSTRSTTARAASALVCDVPESSNSNTDASRPRNSGRARSMRSAISTGRTRQRSAGNNTLRTSRVIKAIMPTSNAMRRSMGNRASASSNPSTASMAIVSAINEAIAATMVSRRAACANRTTA